MELLSGDSVYHESGGLQIITKHTMAVSIGRSREPGGGDISMAMGEATQRELIRARCGGMVLWGRIDGMNR
jgi:hypothetical protein